MSQKRVIRIKLNGDGKAPPLAPPVKAKSKSELNLDEIKVRAALAAKKNGTSQVKELARLVENFLNQD